MSKCEKRNEVYLTVAPISSKCSDEIILPDVQTISASPSESFTTLFVNSAWWATPPQAHLSANSDKIKGHQTFCWLLN